MRFWSTAALVASIAWGVVEILNAEYQAAGLQFQVAVWAGLCAEVCRGER